MWCIRRFASLVACCPARAVRTVSTQKKIGVVGACFEKGQPLPGVASAPTALRATGFINRLQELGHDIVDYGDVKEERIQNRDLPAVGPDGEKNHVRVLEFNQKLASVVECVRKDGRICLTLGGDHSIAIGSVSGHSAALSPDQKLMLLWVDAHPDIHTGKSSTTGNMHGMPVGQLLHKLADDASRLPSQWPPPCLFPENIAYIGLRDLDSKEQNVLRDFGITAYGMPEIDKLGIIEVVSRCLDQLNPNAGRPLHVSFDIDSLDPVHAPSTGTPVVGGLTVREAATLLESASRTSCLGALDIVEVNPKLSTPEDVSSTILSAQSIIYAALAEHRGT